MSLPSNWVDEIFSKLMLVYGHDFSRRWDGIDMATVKADWARELSRYQQVPSAIKWALQNLPAVPPNSVEFRALCARRPDAVAQPLPSPKANPAIVAQCLASLSQQQIEEPPTEGPDLRWANRIMARHQRGERVRKAVLDMARSALAKREPVTKDEA